MEILSLLEIENLTYYYPECKHPVLKNINLQIEEGEFLLIVGGSGSGKSSLARVMVGLIPDFYGGKFTGKVLLKNKPLRDFDRRSICELVGIVFQDPEKQLVMTTVEAEIVFGLENLGLPQKEMFRRTAEVMSFLNLTPLKGEFTANLSGGQKQKVALASVLAMQPRVLILDEPTSQLDPMAADEFFNLIEYLNDEMGYTIILIEQRLEKCFHLADRLVVMKNGEIIQDGPVNKVAKWEVENSLPFIPPVAKFFASIKHSSNIPLTVKEGRKFLKNIAFHFNSDTSNDKIMKQLYPISKFKKGNHNSLKELVTINNVWFTYPNGREVLKGINMKVEESELVVILGENAAGKTTLLKNMVGILKPGRGSVIVMNKDTRKTPLTEISRYIGYLSQNPNDYLFQDTVKDELLFTVNNLGLDDNGVIDDTLKKLGLSQYKDINPRDLSSGERQRVALASVLVAKPKLLVLDEPTRGIDYRLKNELGELLINLKNEGITVIVVTHDVEFAAEYAERVIMMFDGRIVSDGPKYQVLGESLFYAPQMARLFKDISDNILTVRDGIQKIYEKKELKHACIPS